MMFIYLLMATLANVTQGSWGTSTSSTHTRMAAPTPTLAPTKGTLGSAMISSVTHALAPILPFAGGVDLRRDGEWLQWRSWVQHLVLDRSGEYRSDDPTTVESSASNVVRQIPRGGGRHDSHDKRRVAASAPRTAAVSATEPFVSTPEIEQMTLEDISFAFEYAIQSGRRGFDVSSFLQEGYQGQPLSDHMMKIQSAIDDVTRQSRGVGVEPADTAPLLHHQDAVTTYKEGSSLSLGGFGDVDALQFCAAMRLLAEWRVLRQVPPGYKGYAVGMGLGQKDVVQNVAKMEDAVHAWIQERADDLALEQEMIARVEKEECLLEEEECRTLENQAYPPRSPTLRQLLQHEVETNIHPNHKLPRLRDQTAAMGLLWVRRQLQYQTTIFNNVASVPEVFPTMVDAVGGAYSEVYGDIHGWAVQKIFNYSFQSAPDAHEIFRFMNPKRLEQVRMVVQNGDFGSSSSKEEDVSTNAFFVRNSDETVLVFEKDDEIVVTLSNNLADDDSFEGANIDSSQFTRLHLTEKRSDKHPLLRFGDHIGSEWDKLGEEVEKLSRHIGSEFERAGSHIENEWSKLVCGVTHAFNEDERSKCEEINKKHCSSNVTDQRGPYFNKSPRTSSDFESNVSNQMSTEEMEEYVTKQMEIDARSHIDTYLTIAHPVLTDLAGLFAEMNMDDPTKV